MHVIAKGGVPGACRIYLRVVEKTERVYPALFYGYSRPAPYVVSRGPAFSSSPLREPACPGWS